MLVNRIKKQAGKMSNGEFYDRLLNGDRLGGAYRAELYYSEDLSEVHRFLGKEQFSLQPFIGCSVTSVSGNYERTDHRAYSLFGNKRLAKSDIGACLHRYRIQDNERGQRCLLYAVSDERRNAFARHLRLAVPS